METQLIFFVCVLISFVPIMLLAALLQYFLLKRYEFQAQSIKHTLIATIFISLGMAVLLRPALDWTNINSLWVDFLRYFSIYAGKQITGYLPVITTLIGVGLTTFYTSFRAIKAVEK